MSACTYACISAHGGQKKMISLLDLELVIGSCELPNLGSPQEQQALLTTELLLQENSFFLYCDMRKE